MRRWSTHGFFLVKLLKNLEQWAGVTPFIVAGIEFSKRIIAQKRCSVCKGSGLVQREKYFFRCYSCGGFLPWQSWKRFFSGWRGHYQENEERHSPSSICISSSPVSSSLSNMALVFKSSNSNWILLFYSFNFSNIAVAPAILMILDQSMHSL